MDRAPADRPGAGDLIDKGTKGKRARRAPIIIAARDLLKPGLDAATTAGTRLFIGPRGGRVSTAVLRGATHWDAVVEALGFGHLRRHDLRHTGSTWPAGAGVPVHVLRKIAGHGSMTTTQRYLRPDRRCIEDAGTAPQKFERRRDDCMTFNRKRVVDLHGCRSTTL